MLKSKFTKLKNVRTRARMTIRGHCSPQQFLVSQVKNHCEEEMHNIRFCANLYHWNSQPPRHVQWFVRIQSSAFCAKTCERMLRHSGVCWDDCAAFCILRTPSCRGRSARREEQDREFVLISPTQSSNVLNVHKPHSIQKPQLFAGRSYSIGGPQFAHTCRRLLCSKIADLHGIEVHDVRTRKFVYFRKIFRFLLNNIRDVTKGSRGHNPPSAESLLETKKSQQCHKQFF